MDDQDKSLENLFRDKAGLFSDFSYREKDWMKLEKRLDELDLKKRYRRRIAILAAASLLLVGLMGYFTLKNHHEINELSEQINQLEKSRKSESPGVGDELAGSNENGNSSDVAEREEGNKGITDQSETVTEFNAINEEATSASGATEKLTTINAENLDEYAINNRADRQILAENLFLSANRKPVVNDDQIYALRSTPERNTVNSFSESADKISRSAQIGSDEIPSERSSLTIGLMFSPDMSTAGGVSNFDDPGFKGGVLAEYSFSDRFSIRSGAILSNVRYKAGKNDYRAPENWNNGISPEETSALCLILDIPVSVKANLIDMDRSTFYVTGGVSTYVMLNEEYEFDFGTNASPDFPDEWQGQTGDRFWASNLSISLGYERNLSSRLTLRAEPHIYVPIREVGWGNVKLYSMGTSVSLNFRM